MPVVRIGEVTTGARPLIAVPLTDREVRGEAEPEAADIIELRVDMFENLTAEYVAHVVEMARERFSKPLITTVRSYSEGGAVKIEDRKRKELFKAIIDLTDAVDIEIESDIFGGIVRLARKRGKTSIASFHDFSATPGIDELSGIIRKGKSFRADIVKIAVMPNSMGDLRVITDLTLRYHEQGIITIAMGELGMASRIFLPMIGSLITFASLDISTAPGQLSIHRMKEFFSVLEGDTISG